MRGKLHARKKVQTWWMWGADAADRLRADWHRGHHGGAKTGEKRTLGGGPKALSLDVDLQHEQVFASLEELGKWMEWRKARHTKRRV